MARCITDHEHFLTGIARPVLDQTHFETTGNILGDIFAALSCALVHKVLNGLDVLGEWVNAESLIVLVIPVADEADSDLQLVFWIFILAFLDHIVNDFTQSFLGTVDPWLH